MLVSVIITILAFGVMIMLHEAGHFFTAKRYGVLVHEFAIGMGPKIISFGKGETKYSLRLLPFGGYCKMEGEDGESDSERSFLRLSAPKRIVILVAGAFMNLLLGFLILVIINFASGAVRTNEISDVIDFTGAQAAGMQKGDKITALNSQSVHIGSDVDFFMSQNKEKTVSVTIERGGERKTFDVTPTLSASRYILGVKIAPIPQSFFGNIKCAFYETIYVAKLVMFSLAELVTGRLGLRDMSGPVGIVGVVDDVKNAASTTKNAWLSLSWLFALISVNLGVFNLLPFPALDGGSALICAVEFVTKKRVPPRVLGYINFVGFALLMLLAVAVLMSDIGKIVLP